MRYERLTKEMEKLINKYSYCIEHWDVERDEFFIDEGHPYAVWVYLKPEYYCHGMGGRIIHEATAKELKDMLEMVEESTEEA